MSDRRTKRLQTELARLKKSSPPGITLVHHSNFREWEASIQLIGRHTNPLYSPNETFRVRFVFHSDYPISPPDVTFRAKSGSYRIPVHPHVYSNGVICLNILGKSGWTAAMTVESVCLSLQSMLDANREDSRPADDEMVRHSAVRSSSIGFHYNDDRV